MPDVSNRNREKAPGIGGRFAAENHAVPALELQTPAPSPFTLAELERVRKLHGTMHADTARDYYPTMDKVFEAARALAGSGTEAAGLAATDEAIDRYAARNGVPADELRDFYDDVQHYEPGSEAWKKALERTYAPGGIDLVSAHRDVRASADEIRKAKQAERRQLLVETRARIDAELAELDA